MLSTISLVKQLLQLRHNREIPTWLDNCLDLPPPQKKQKSFLAQYHWQNPYGIIYRREREGVLINIPSNILHYLYKLLR